MKSADILFQEEGYKARPLVAEDGDQLQALCERCADYSELIEGAPPDSAAAQSLFYSLPDGKLDDDKFLIGLFLSSGHLFGIMDVIRDYPEGGVWFTGLLLLEPGQRNRGVGARVVDALERWAAGLGAREMRLTVAEENARALRFWKRIGYRETGRRLPRRFSHKEHVLIVMKRDLRR